MRKKTFLTLLGALSFIIISATAVVLLTGDNAILNPKGEIAQKQYNLLVFATLLSMLVILPVFALTIYISLNYRASKKPKDYQPNWDHSKKAETVWWGLPIVIIIILSIVTWKSTHDLDPFKPIASDQKPLQIQVVSLQWKWLFLYPEYGLASINYAQIPVDRPVEFELTSDAPMNSFWVPQLGGQIYTMTGMSTKLHLIANEAGEYRGVSSNISGNGFADMKFLVAATSDSEFYDWTHAAKGSTESLDQQVYEELRKPSKMIQPKFLTLAEPNLYGSILAKYNDHSHHMKTNDQETHNKDHTDNTSHTGGHH